MCNFTHYAICTMCFAEYIILHTVCSFTCNVYNFIIFINRTCIVDMQCQFLCVEIYAFCGVVAIHLYSTLSIFSHFFFVYFGHMTYYRSDGGNIELRCGMLLLWPNITLINRSAPPALTNTLLLYQFYREHGNYI